VQERARVRARAVAEAEDRRLKFADREFRGSILDDRWLKVALGELRAPIPLGEESAGAAWPGAAPGYGRGSVGSGLPGVSFRVAAITGARGC